MAWERSTRRQRLPDNWDEIRTPVRNRAAGQCEAVDDGIRCPAPGVECDHIIPGDDHRPENLQWLCGWHHGRKSGSEGGRASAAARRNRRRKPPRHPGLIA
ncbi:MAG: HNH endonuclease [bacterium]